MLSESMNSICNSRNEAIDTAFHPAERRDILVVLAHGVTGNMDRPLLVALAERLAARGFPCLRFSFSGNGESQGTFGDATITKEVADLGAVLDAVPEEVDVVYVGHSQGAAVGVLRAASDLRIRLLVSLAGMVRTAEFYEKEFGALEPGTDVMWEEESCPISPQYAADMRKIGDVLGPAARVPQPWLLIHGTADDVVDPENSRAAAAATRAPHRLVEIEGEGHSFSETSYAQIADEIAAWIKSHLPQG